MNFDEFKQAVFNAYKMDLNGYKENQLKRRIDTLLSAVNIHTYEDYLVKIKDDQVEKQKFFDKITINVSEFFRNPDIFSFLEKSIIPDLLENFENLKIWSAACSNGSEPYSIAMILDKTAQGKNFSIDATDIDPLILEQARKGEYSDIHVKNISTERMQKYFTQQGESYCLNPLIKNHVNFRKQDLILDNYNKGYHLIVCRNVTIYFTRETQEKIYQKFYDALVEGGVLFIGATESIFNYREIGFERISPWFYKKEGSK